MQQFALQAQQSYSAQLQQVKIQCVGHNPGEEILRCPKWEELVYFYATNSKMAVTTTD